MRTTTRKAGYKYRLEPNRQQAQKLDALFGATRVVFNDFVARRNEVHTQDIREDFNDTRAKVLVHSKKTPERAWLKNYSAIALQSSVQNAINGYLKFYKELEKKNTTGKTPRRISPPKFKSKRSDQAATFRDKRFIKVNKLNKTFSETNIPASAGSSAATPETCQHSRSQ